MFITIRLVDYRNSIKLPHLVKIMNVETSDDEAWICSCICFFMHLEHSPMVISVTCGCDYLANTLPLPSDSDPFKGNSL